MHDEDPFFGSGDSDRTVLRPRPGGHRGAGAQTPPRPEPSYAAQGSAQPAALERLGGGLNPITGAATTLVALMTQLRESAQHPDPEGLFGHISRELQQFEAAARSNGEPPDNVLAARYVLCTALDETVLNTPWGSQSHWANRTLLATFHNETWGGEKFFQLLDRLLQEPARNLHLLELMYLCLALGFEGKYRIRERGRAELERIQDNLFQVIRTQQGEFERGLSPRWRGLQDRRPRLAQYVPLWVVAAVAASVLIIVYVGFLVAVNGAADPALADVSTLGRNVALPARERTPSTPRPSVDLRPYLQAELAEGRVEITDVPHGQIVRMAGDGLFDSGRAEIQGSSAPLLRSIGEALARVPGRIRITGHTDDVPMSAFGRYKSNWDLSQARAEAVRDILSSGAGVEAGRMSAEGVADTQPIVSNDSPANRARNRRVEIELLAQAGRQ